MPTKPRNSGKRRKPRQIDKELVDILRFWIYPTEPPRSDKWISERALYDALVKWKVNRAKP